MKNTERLLGIALAVLALEGCRGPQHAQQPENRPSQSPSASAAGGHVMAHGGGGYVAGAAAARAGTAEGESSHGGFGDAGAHGAGG
jgi:hypothetical protein